MGENFPATSRSTPRNVYVFGLTSFLNDTASEMAYWLLPAFLASLGAGPAQLGIIEGIAESMASFAKLFSGYVTDRVSRRKPIVVAGYFVANAVKPMLALVSSWWQILGIRFCDRFAKGVRGTARDVMVAESVEKSALGSAYGLIQAMDSAGAISGPLLALAIIGRFGMRGVFASAAIPGALCVLVAWIGIREVRRGGKPLAETGTNPESLRPQGAAPTRTGEDARCSTTSRIPTHATITHSVPGIAADANTPRMPKRPITANASSGPEMAPAESMA